MCACVKDFRVKRARLFATICCGCCVCVCVYRVCAGILMLAPSGRQRACLPFKLIMYSRIWLNRKKGGSLSMESTYIHMYVQFNYCESSSLTT